ncbi:MAG: hypothetical protein QNJ54_23205 [Prochloraceae cyanobacterium]|nr:hypothetical protein [Prochloraceae cyanobacterium]
MPNLPNLFDSGLICMTVGTFLIILLAPALSNAPNNMFAIVFMTISVLILAAGLVLIILHEETQT